MTAVLLDTHVWAYTLHQSVRLSKAARTANDLASTRYLSPVSIYEIAQKVRIGKWSEMAPFTDSLLDVIEQQGIQVAPLDPSICLRAGSMEWLHRDPFDRLLAATALALGLPIISADTIFDGVVSRIW